MKDFFKDPKEQRALEEKLYLKVAEEIEANNINKGLWTKALAESGNDTKKAEGLYIQFRVQKLKDEIEDQVENEEKEQNEQVKQKQKQVKNVQTLENLNASIEISINRFKTVSAFFILIGFIGLIFYYVVVPSFDGFYSWLAGFIFLICFGSYTYYTSYKIQKTDDFSEKKKKANILFIIAIPSSFLLLLLGFLNLILGLVMLVVFISLIINAVKFNLAYRYAKKNHLF